MTSIVGKRISGKTYYYLVESARVDGQPRIVSQQYLGSAEDVTARLAGAQIGVPMRTQHKGFGDLAAVWGALPRTRYRKVDPDRFPGLIPRRHHRDRAGGDPPGNTDPLADGQPASPALPPPM